MKLIRTLENSVFIYLIIINIIGHCNGYFYSNKNAPTDNSCFCELGGSIDDCSCNVDTVDHFNNNKIFPRLKSLLVKDYFRFYKVNLKKECPFWADDSKCAMKFCNVNACEEKDIPEGLKGQYRIESPIFKYAEENQIIDCHDDHNSVLSFLNTSISKTARKHFQLWADYDDNLDNYCILDDHQDDAVYVDLLLNPEKYTGYRGDSAHRIWRSIYLENCFGTPYSKNTLFSHINKSPYSDSCMEERAFYRLISGLHTSINIHLCSNYLLSESSKDFMTPNGIWGRNVQEFQQRFDPDGTNNQGPHWLRNLYFAYIVELRALAKAAPYLKREKYFTGIDEEDDAVQLAIRDLLNIIETFPSHFNESLMFTGSSESLKLKSEFREKFRNISKIMECVGCDKCRLWGKLQVQGLGTALKILFSGKFDINGGTVKQPLENVEENTNFKLRRGEIVSLFNAFGRLSNSINELEQFRKDIR